MKSAVISADHCMITGRIRLPSSKSITNRAFLMQALAGIPFEIHNASHAEDSLLMKQLLEQIHQPGNSGHEVALDCQNAGTVFRFLTAFLASTPGTWLLTGNARMKQRPVGILVDALTHLGADIHYEGITGFPPLLIRGRKLNGGQLKIDGSVSSQFISALLMIAPILENGLALTLINTVSSRPYIDMTLGLMNHFGIDTKQSGNRIDIPKQDYKPRPLFVETDWSSAAFWYELAALATEADLNLPGLSQPSLQGDSILLEIYNAFGISSFFHEEGLRILKNRDCTDHFTFDFSHHPDLALPVIVTCAGLGIKAYFSGLASLRIKETDRVAALCEELDRLGFEPEPGRNHSLLLKKRQPLDMVNKATRTSTGALESIDSHADHRMAMAFAPLACILGSIGIRDAAVVAKSYPGFWNDLISAGLRVELF